MLLKQTHLVKATIDVFTDCVSLQLRSIGLLKRIRYAYNMTYAWSLFSCVCSHIVHFFKYNALHKCCSFNIDAAKFRTILVNCLWNHVLKYVHFLDLYVLHCQWNQLQAILTKQVNTHKYLKWRYVTEEGYLGGSERHLIYATICLYFQHA